MAGQQIDLRHRNSEVFSQKYVATGICSGQGQGTSSRNSARIGQILRAGTRDLRQIYAVGDVNLDAFVEGGDSHKEVGFDPIEKVIGLNIWRIEWRAAGATTGGHQENRDNDNKIYKI